jgi:hypothetical protein
MRRKNCFQLCVLVALVALILPPIGASATSATPSVTAICNVVPGNDGAAARDITLAAVNDTNDLIIAATATTEGTGATTNEMMVLENSGLPGIDVCELKFLINASSGIGATCGDATAGLPETGGNVLKFPMMASSSMTAAGHFYCG